MSHTTKARSIPASPKPILEVTNTLTNIWTFQNAQVTDYFRKKCHQILFQNNPYENSYYVNIFKYMDLGSKKFSFNKVKLQRIREEQFTLSLKERKRRKYFRI